MPVVQSHLLSIEYKMYLKLHKSYRTVVACCDKELLGKRIVKGLFLLDVRPNFYKDLELSEEKAKEVLERQALEDATFNLVGKKSVELGLELGIIEKEHVREMENIPFALSL